MIVEFVKRSIRCSCSEGLKTQTAICFLIEVRFLHPGEAMFASYLGQLPNNNNKKPKRKRNKKKNLKKLTLNQ